MKACRGSGGIAPQHWVEVNVRLHASAAFTLYPLNRRVDGPKIWSASKQILDPAAVSLVTKLFWLPF
jgi:hypothetical protein